jgi:heme-degrading monooxygenase HmoA
VFTRIGTWQGSPDELEEWVTRASRDVKPNVSRQPGLIAAFWLVDRENGKGLTVTVWESEAAMCASERFRERSQAQTADATGASVTTDRFEVVDSVMR